MPKGLLLLSLNVSRSFVIPKLIKKIKVHWQTWKSNMHNPKTWQLQIQISDVMWWWVQQSEKKKSKNNSVNKYVI